MAVVPRNSTYIIRKERNNQNQLFNAVNTTNFEEKTLQLSGDFFKFLFLFFFYANHPLQGFRSHCSVRGYSSPLVATAGAEATTRTGRQHTHAHTHTLNPQLNPLLPPNMT